MNVRVQARKLGAPFPNARISKNFATTPRVFGGSTRIGTTLKSEDWFVGPLKDSGGLHGSLLKAPLHRGRGRARDHESKKMENPTEKDVIHRAYQLWEEAGKPEGRDEEFYHQAEQELRNEDKSSPLRTPDNL
jgi:hypothetical protein